MGWPGASTGSDGRAAGTLPLTCTRAHTRTLGKRSGKAWVNGWKAKKNSGIRWQIRVKEGMGDGG